MRFLLAAFRRALEDAEAGYSRSATRSELESMAGAGSGPAEWDVHVVLHGETLEVALEPARTSSRAPVAEAGPKEFGPWLRGRLRAEGISQELAARRLGVSPRTVGRWVRGDTEPRFRDLPGLREAFGPLPQL